MQKFRTWETFDEMKEDGIHTKEDLAKEMQLKEKSRAFDYALPQCWLDTFYLDSPFTYDAVQSTTFWVYEHGYTFGRPVSGLELVQKTIEEARQ